MKKTGENPNASLKSHCSSVGWAGENSPVDCFPAHAVKSQYCSPCGYSYRNYHRVGGEPAHLTIPA